MPTAKTQPQERAGPVFLSVIVPSYNEERRILRTLIAIDAYLSLQPYASEILVVSDGSRDATVSIIEGLQKLIPNLLLIANPENRGKGHVVRQGMLASRGEFRVFTDADNSTSPDHVEKMWPFFREGYGVVIGSRDVRGAVRAVPQSKWKEWLGDLGNIFIQVVAGLWGIWDTQCGFKGFSQKAAEDIFSRARIRRWGFDVEVLAIGRALGYRIREIPVYWVNDPFSHVSARAYFEVLWETVKIRWNLWRDAYDIRKARLVSGQARELGATLTSHPRVSAGSSSDIERPVTIEKRRSSATSRRSDNKRRGKP